MIGHLQTNKCREAVRLFELIHSVDSLQLAEPNSIVVPSVRPRRWRFSSK
jgi:uncharacterized pyridoxal phosphate-containing UPF0001 family protein